VKAALVVLAAYFEKLIVLENIVALIGNQKYFGNILFSHSISSGTSGTTTSPNLIPQ
jgi:hypothetical protein